MDAKMIIGALATVFLLLAGAIGYSTGYAEGKDRALRDNVSHASIAD